MEIKATLRHLHMSPRKVSLVAAVVRGLSATDAVDQLRFLNKHAALPVRKLVESAIANAENNFKLKKEDLRVKEIRVNMGPALKRYRARAFGRAAEIKKRSSHVYLILTDGAVVTKAKPKSKKSAVAKKQVAFDEVTHGTHHHKKSTDETAVKSQTPQNVMHDRVTIRQGQD